uniref:Secreted RxLR effector n=1 Tax=Bremia lactucae TaxID=4779 RepID=A0A3B7TFH9_BRELC|nr:secreted RxLR effector [Bremia lactucae]
MLFSVFFFLVATCVKSSYGHSVAVSTRDPENIALQLHEYASIPETIETIRRLRGALAHDATAYDERMFFENAANKMYAIAQKTRLSAAAVKKLIPESQEKKLLSYYLTKMKGFIKDREALYSITSSYDELALLGVTPDLFRTRLLSVESPEVAAARAIEYEEYIKNICFVSSEKNPCKTVTELVESNKFDKIKELMEKHSIAELLIGALTNLNKVNHLDKLTTRIQLKYVLENTPELGPLLSRDVNELLKDPSVSKIFSRFLTFVYGIPS